MDKRLPGLIEKIPILAQDQIYRRLRDNPESRDIVRGDALNVAMDEINDPRVYSRALEGAKVKIGGEVIRDIPFQYAAAAITTSFHQVSQGPPPAVLLKPEYEANRTALKALGQEIYKQIEDGGIPDPENVGKALTLINALEAQVDKTLPRNSRDRVETDRYLKSLHGLLGMLQTPAIHVILSGVENRPEATLGDLLTFMNAFNLRFGPADTPRQWQIYDSLYPKLDTLRDQIAPLLATTSPTKPEGNEAGEFFSGMSYEDLQKKGSSVFKCETEGFYSVWRHFRPRSHLKTEEPEEGPAAPGLAATLSTDAVRSTGTLAFPTFPRPVRHADPHPHARCPPPDSNAQSGRRRGHEWHPTPLTL